MKYPILVLLAMLLLASCSKEKIDKVVSFSDTNFAITDIDLQTAYSIQPTSDGYIVAAGNEEIQLMKLDRNIEIEWINNYGEKAKSERLEVQVAHDGGFVVAGSKSKANNGEFVAHIIKADKLGEPIWMRNYGVYSNSKAHSIMKGSNDEFVFVGSDQYSGSNGSNYTVNWIDKEGISFAAIDDDETVQDEAWSIVNAGNNEYTVLFSASNNRSKHKIGLAKYTASSELLWKKMYDEFPTTNKGYKLIKVKDGFIVLGNAINGSNGDSDILIMKTDNQGSLIWSQIYGGAMDDIAYSILQTQDKGLVIVGMTESYGVGKNDVYILKLNKNGKLKWSRTYGGLRDDVAYDVVEAANGDLIICGEREESLFVLNTDKKGYPN